jgi:hypothetical protein
MSAPVQLSLDVRTAAPEVSVVEVEMLCAHLTGREWQTAAQISAELGIDDRRVRAIAEHSDGRILSGPGCPGYRLFTGATEIGEADRCASRLESQARKMLHRAASIRRRFHRYAR